MAFKEASEFTTEELKGLSAQIDAMDQTEMARRWRFAPAGDPMFRGDLPLYKKFQERFSRLGGMTPEISKKIGLGD
jgi:hypothetical protein